MSQGDAVKELDGSGIVLIKKAVKADTKLVTSDVLLLEDEFQSLYYTPRKNTNVVIEPPFNPMVLAALTTRNNVLQQCITAMEVNIDGTGYEFVLLDPEEDKETGDDEDSDDSGEDDQDLTGKIKKLAFVQQEGNTSPQSPEQNANAKPSPFKGDPDSMKGKPKKDDPKKKKADPELDREKEMLEHFFSEPYPGMSFVTMRRKLRVDMETTGNAYLEVIRNVKGEIVFLRHLEAVAMRIVKLDSPVDVEVTVMRGGDEITATIPMRERRYCFKVGANLVYYRDFGSSRQINKKTGAWFDKEDKTKPDTSVLGSEVIHFTLNKDFRTRYGLPRWINQLPSVLGSRKAEEYNLEFFDAGGMPPAIIFVQGGALVGGVKEQLQQYLSGKASQKHRAAIVEVTSTSGSLDSAGSVKVTTERFGSSTTDFMFEKYDNQTKEHIRMSFRIPPILIGSCFSEDTEYLTSKGWLRFDQITTEDIAQVDKDTFTLSFSQPLKKYDYDYDGDILHIKNRGIDTMVTPNHRMLVRAVTLKKNKTWEFVESCFLPSIKNCLGGHAEFPVSCNWVGEHQATFTFPEVVRKNGRTFNPNQSRNKTRDLERAIRAKVKHAAKTVDFNDFAEFLGYFVSEGSLLKKVRGQVCLSQNAGDVADKMISCVSRMGFTPKVVIHRENQYLIHISDCVLYDWLSVNCGFGAKNKKLPEVIQKATPAQIGIFLTAAIDGDGTRPKGGSEGSFGYASTSKELIDSIQLLSFKLGYASTVRYDSRTRSEKHNPIYTLSAHQDETHMFNIKKQITHAPYKGKVHCFAMPKGTIVTRRNGRVLIAGNSQDYNLATSLSSLKAAESQVFQPERFEFDEIINNTIIKGLGAKRYVMRSKGTSFADAELQVKAMQFASQKLGGEELIKTLNEITGLAMEYDEDEDPAQQQQPSPFGDDFQGGADLPDGFDKTGDQNDYQSQYKDPTQGVQNGSEGNSLGDSAFGKLQS